MKHFTSGLSAAAKTTLRSSPSSTHFHEISIPRDPVTTFRTSQNVSVIDLINRFRRPRSQIPEILGYQCDAHALCKARHHRLTVYERNLSAFSPIFSRGKKNLLFTRVAAQGIFPAGTSGNRSLAIMPRVKREIFRLLSIRAPIIPLRSRTSKRSAFCS